MERLAPFELSLPFIKNIHIYIYTVPYTFNHLVHSNTTLYCIYIYIHYLFSMFISNNNEFFINCSLQWILAFHSSSFSEAGLVAERGYTFRARRWRTIRWWRYTGAGTQRDAVGLKMSGDFEKDDGCWIFKNTWKFETIFMSMRIYDIYTIYIY